VKLWKQACQTLCTTHSKSREDRFSPPYHIQLGLMKQFLKALNSFSAYSFCFFICFQHIVSAFPKLWFDKIKAGVFDGPQIRTLARDEEFVTVTRNVLGNKKSDNYHLLVTSMLLAYRDLGCKMSIKLHFLHSHLDNSPGLLMMNKVSGFIKTL